MVKHYRRFAVHSLMHFTVASAPARGGDLLSDTYNRPDSPNISASSVGMGGTLAPFSYFQTSGAQVAGQSLQLVNSFGNTWVFPLHDFTDASITGSHGFRVAFDLTTPDSMDAQGHTDWGAISIGYSQADASAPGLKMIGNKALGVLF